MFIFLNFCFNHCFESVSHNWRQTLRIFVVNICPSAIKQDALLIYWRDALFLSNYRKARLYTCECRCVGVLSIKHRTWRDCKFTKHLLGNQMSGWNRRTAETVTHQRQKSVDFLHGRSKQVLLSEWLILTGRKCLSSNVVL